MISYLSVCSGIEAATVAWEPLGWSPVAFSEIEKFPSAALAHHYPETPNLGDMTNYHEWPADLRPDLLVGGTPCQSFSVAGLRKGLADPRGNLSLVFLGLADRYRPRWVVWENVYGVLSDKTGAFGALRGGLEKLGYGTAYRVLDAQYFGVPQRRRRVFLVGYLGDWRPPAAVLFERESLRRDSPPCRESGKDIARALRGRAQSSHREDSDNFVAHSLRGEGFDASEDGTGRGTPLIPETCGAITDGAHNGGGLNGQDAYTGRIIPCGGDKPHVLTGAAVRRLTPRECERLQGFPDDYTRIPYRGKTAEQCPDGPRYKALGNSMAVPVMEWIGQRIALIEHLVESITSEQSAQS